MFGTVLINRTPRLYQADVIAERRVFVLRKRAHDVTVSVGWGMRMK